MRTATSFVARALLPWLVVGAAGCMAPRFGASPAAQLEAYAAPTMMAAGYPAPTPGEPEMNTEAYSHIVENDMLRVADSPLSTFSIDVDTASYSNVRRFLDEGSLPPPDAVRIEELVNYFDYDYPQPQGKEPFSVSTEVGPSPWHAGNRLVHIGLQGRAIAPAAVPPRNLVFLLDVSGSMDDPRKLPLVTSSLDMLVAELRPEDHVSLVVYAGASGVVLEPTAGDHKEQIRSALARLHAGGSTNGGAGIELAYALASKHFDPKAINRVILATDGDFNVGVSDEGSLVRLIEAERQKGIFLTVLGFGTGNVKDSTMEKLADHGNGNYAYIDSLAEAKKVLVTQAGGTLVTIAKDVKIQVEFNPATVRAYRLIGYENRVLAARDFNDDKKDAGEIGAGHSVTALYELEPAGAAGGAPGEVDPLKYQADRALTTAAAGGALLTVKLRYKEPDADQSVGPLAFEVKDSDHALAATSADFRFSAAVASYGMLLRKSKHLGAVGWADAATLADGALGADAQGYRRDFVRLLAKAQKLAGGTATLAN
ncbi:MAG: VWA domain-containing protein [Polyangiaceae bacterium]|nr:VWA domain-containing protein [Polyangiaceae bacterium]